MTTASITPHDHGLPMTTAWPSTFGPDPLATPVDWPALAARWDWMQALAACPQDPAYHAEGDVLTHTRMVCEALAGDEDWRSADAETRAATFAAALLHDVAKPACTREEDGRIVAPGHAARGAAMAQRILYRDGDAGTPPIDFALRQRIVGLVRWHGLPLWAWDKVDPERAVIEASWRLRCDHLALLARADVLGRTCADQGDLLDRIALFEGLCRDQQCWDGARDFASDHSRFLYFRRPARHPDYAAYDDTRCEVVMLSGLPGAGKDTWLRAHLPEAPVVSLDALRQVMRVDPADAQGPVVERAKALARMHLRAQQSFVWNATNLTRTVRRGLIDLFADYNARIRIVYVEAPWPEILRRNRERAAQVPEAVLRRLAGRLEVPDRTEAHDVAYEIG